MGHVVRMKRLAKELIQEGNDLYFYTNEQICVEMLASSMARSFVAGIKRIPSNGAGHKRAKS